ncbi:MAG TPA: 2-amino-4-hydroxy-6-hydroxymethyldihydropteridine diphosphokinase [Anaerolineae bacterium]|nr:2-amino-4-hydroxy-6-hydroxymethyldihydropteridine diphosphokinase [Anaerolineae bacterium]
MARVLIAMGSNIDPERNLREAVRRLAERCDVLATSPVYETAPVGKTDQPNFLNAAVLIETGLDAGALKEQVLRAIEQELGRVRTEDKNAPRTIDLDIVLYRGQVVDPDVRRYAHVAVPLADLAPEVRDPETGQTLATIAGALPASGLHRRDDVALQLHQE